MKILYLAAGNGLLKYEDVTYQDLIIKRDLGGDMLNIDLTLYDLIVATPPCNFWSKASGNKTSQYALDTKNLLPKILEKLIFSHKPYISNKEDVATRIVKHYIEMLKGVRS